MPAGDITYIHTREGFVYLATVTRPSTRKELLATHGRNMRTELVPNPLEMAVRNSQPIKSMTILPFRFREHKVHIRRLHRHHEQVWFPRIGGKNRRVLRQRSSGIIQRHLQERTRQPEDLPHQKKSNQRGDIMD